MTSEQLKRLAEIAGLATKPFGKDIVALNKEYVATWNPHEDIAQAMMVAEKVTADMFELTLEKGRWFATFYFNLDADNQTEVECEKPTPAEAICAAALAIGG